METLEDHSTYRLELFALFLVIHLAQEAAFRVVDPGKEFCVEESAISLVDFHATEPFLRIATEHAPCCCRLPWLARHDFD